MDTKPTEPVEEVVHSLGEIVDKFPGVSELNLFLRVDKGGTQHVSVVMCGSPVGRFVVPAESTHQGTQAE